MFFSSMTPQMIFLLPVELLWVVSYSNVWSYAHIYLHLYTYNAINEFYKYYNIHVTVFVSFLVLQILQSYIL